RAPGHERLRAGRWQCLSQLFRLRPRPRWPVGRLPMARPRAEGPQRTHLLVAPPRQIRKRLILPELTSGRGTLEALTNEGGGTFLPQISGGGGPHEVRRRGLLASACDPPGHIS